MWGLPEVIIEVGPTNLGMRLASIKIGGATQEQFSRSMSPRSGPQSVPILLFLGAQTGRGRD